MFDVVYGSLVLNLQKIVNLSELAKKITIGASLMIMNISGVFFHIFKTSNLSKP